MAVIMAFGMLACEDSSSDEPEATGGISGKVLDLSGGAGGATGTGGKGGDLDMDWYGTSGILFLKSGNVNTSFSVPTWTNVVDLGTDGWTVDTDYTVQVYDGTEPAAGFPEYHTHPGNTNLYYGDGGVTVVDTIVTGIRIDRGVELTLEPNYDSGDTACEDQAYLTLANDLDIRGTLTVTDVNSGPNCAGAEETRHGVINGATTLDSASLYIDPNRIYLRGTGVIDTLGANATAADTRGGDGGYVYLEADTGIFLDGTILAGGGAGLGTGEGGNGGIRAGDNVDGVVIDSGGSGTNTGDIDCSGGDGADGGDAGPVYLYADWLQYNTGTLSANGGDGDATGTGGGAGWVEVEAYYATVFNRGNLQSNGGDGGVGGGAGNEAYLYGSSNGGDIGSVINAGKLEVNGGDALSNGDGGDAGDMYIYAYGGDVRTSGVLEAMGGDGAGASGDGGYGGYIYFWTEYGYEYYYGQYKQTGDIIISNNIIATGGAGTGSGYGGYGGYVDVGADSTEYAPDMDNVVKFVGFNKFKMNGGDGGNGGNGGGLDAYTYYAYNPGDAYTPAGPINNNVIIEANGGEGLAGGGGDAGWIYLSVYGWYMFDDNSKLINNGRLESNGGDGTTGGGDNGDIWLVGWRLLKNTAVIQSNGGEGTGAAADGGNADTGGYINLISTFDLVNTASLQLIGGDGTVTGGNGGTDFQLWAGGQVRNTGSLLAGGGNGGTTGGDGGEIEVNSAARQTKNSARIDVSGGLDITDRSTDGDVGFIWIDWVDVTPLDGTLGF